MTDEPDDGAVRFRLNFLEAPSDEQICQKLAKACATENRNLADSVSQLTQQVSALRAELQAKDAAIADLKGEIHRLQIKNDDLEQYGRRSSIRVSGIPVGDHDDTDAKLMFLINTELKIDPPLCQTDIITSHRVPSRNASPTDPPPILIKFKSTSIKNRVMKTRADLPDYRRTNERKVYFTEDLTARRAKLFYQTRKIKLNEFIADCWTYNGNIKIKNKRGKVHSIEDVADLNQFVPRDYDISQ